MDKYKVLWIDDELTDFNYSLMAYYDEAEERGIMIEKCPSFAKSDSLLKKGNNYEYHNRYFYAPL